MFIIFSEVLCVVSVSWLLLYSLCLSSQVIAAAQAGWHNEKRESFGDTLIIDPWGRIVARLPGDGLFILLNVLFRWNLPVVHFSMLQSVKRQFGKKKWSYQQNEELTRQVSFFGGGIALMLDDIKIRHILLVHQNICY